jgi:hypothetical protein
VRLFASVDGGPPSVVANGARRLMSQDGVTFPVWDFNDVDISAAAQGHRIEFWMDVAQAGVTTRAGHWVYAADQPQPEPWLQVPTASCS